MKRHGNLYDEIVSMDNIELAYQKAKRNKGWQQKVRRVERRREHYLALLREKMMDGTYYTSPYKMKKVYEPKERTIYVLPFYPDRICQHAVMNVISPIWDRLFIYDSYACREGKGQHAGSLRCMQFVRRNQYVLQCDVSKFYPNINHEVLMQIIERKIKDKRVLALLGEIVRSIGGEKNVPIGNYTSQWFGNLYLNELDMLMKHKYHVKDYMRYCDDFLLFSNDKAFLRGMAGVIRDFLGEHLKLKLSKCSLYPTSQGVDFLGYRHFPSGKILVRKSTAKRIKKQLKTVRWKVKHGRMTREQALSTVCSYSGWIKWANAHHLALSTGLYEFEKELRGGGEAREVME